MPEERMAGRTGKPPLAARRVDPIDAEASLGAASEAAERACALLRGPAPEAVNRAATLLSEAEVRLSAWRNGLAEGRVVASAPALAELRRLRSSALRTRRLLESARAFHEGWRGALGALCAGYTSGGTPAEASLPSRVCIRG